MGYVEKYMWDHLSVGSVVAVGSKIIVIGWMRNKVTMSTMESGQMTSEMVLVL
jgi:hypothetical protein